MSAGGSASLSSGRVQLVLLGEFDLALDPWRAAARSGAIGGPPAQSYAPGTPAATSRLAVSGSRLSMNACESLELSPDPLNSAFATGWLGFAYREQGDSDRAITLPRAGDRVHARVRVPTAGGLVPGVAERGLPPEWRRRPSPRRPIRDCAWPASCATPGASPSLGVPSGGPHSFGARSWRRRAISARPSPPLVDGRALRRGLHPASRWPKLRGQAALP